MCSNPLAIFVCNGSSGKNIFLPVLVSPPLKAISPTLSVPIDSVTNGAKNSDKAPGVLNLQIKI
jgi:hypothetical protein